MFNGTHLINKMVFTTPSHAYLSLLRDILLTPQFVSSPRGQLVNETLSVTYSVEKPSSSAIVTKDEVRNDIIASYTEKEKKWYDSGDRSVEAATAIAKFWGTLANPDQTINSNYGHLLFFDKSEGSDFEGVKRTPWEWAVESLKSDKDTRQAVIRFNKPEHGFKGNKDYVCTLVGVFHIRNSKLYLHIDQRSCDVTVGLVYDLPFFCSLMEKMLEDIKIAYPDVTMGSITHTMHSFHLYHRDLEKAHKMLGIIRG